MYADNDAVSHARKWSHDHPRTSRAMKAGAIGLSVAAAVPLAVGATLGAIGFGVGGVAAGKPLGQTSPSPRFALTQVLRLYSSGYSSISGCCGSGLSHSRMRSDWNSRCGSCNRRRHWCGCVVLNRRFPSTCCTDRFNIFCLYCHP